MIAIRYILYTALFFLPAAGLLMFYFSGNWYSFFHAYSISMWVGILSYVCLLNTLILSARIPILDRLFGHDRVMVFHGYMALTGLALGILHHEMKGTYFKEETLQSGFGTAALVIFFAVIMGALLFLVKGRLHRIPFLAQMRDWFGRTKIGDYSVLKLLHNSVTFAVLAVTVHVLLASSTRENPARMWVTGLYGGIAAAVWVYHKFIRIALLSRKKTSIAAVSEPGPGIVELSVSEQTRMKKRRAGQFAYLRIRSKVCGFEEHPFTISSPPGTPLTFTIKNLGDYTSKLKNLSEGTQVLVDGPYGKFTPEASEKPLLFIAGGIGITPFMSILMEWNAKDFKGPVTLIWSCRTSPDMVHRDFFETCASEHKEFTFIPILTREGDKTRITRNLLESLADKPEEVYFCGPESLRRTCTGYLRTMGIPSGRIHFEKFS